LIEWQPFIKGETRIRVGTNEGDQLVALTDWKSVYKPRTKMLS